MASTASSLTASSEFAGSRDPEHDLGRAPAGSRPTGKVTMLDANTGKPRTVVEIEKAVARIAHRPRPKMR